MVAKVEARRGIRWKHTQKRKRERGTGNPSTSRDSSAQSVFSGSTAIPSPHRKIPRDARVQSGWGWEEKKKKKRLKEWSLAFRTQQKGEFFRSRRHGSFFCKPQWLNSGHARVDFVIAQSERVWRMKASPNRKTGWRFRRDQVRTGGLLRGEGCSVGSGTYRRFLFRPAFQRTRGNEAHQTLVLLPGVLTCAVQYVSAGLLLPWLCSPML